MIETSNERVLKSIFGPTGCAVSLHPVAPEDAPALFPIMSNADLMEYIFPASVDVDDTQKSIAQSIETGIEWLGWWLVRHDESQRPIGLVMYYNRHIWNSYCSIAYVIDTPFQRRGLGLQAVSLAASHLFEHMDINRIEAEVEPSNSPSAALLNRLGFVKEADLMRQRLCINNKRRDVSLYACLKGELRSVFTYF